MQDLDGRLKVMVHAIAISLACNGLHCVAAGVNISVHRLHVKFLICGGVHLWFMAYRRMMY